MKLYPCFRYCYIGVHAQNATLFVWWASTVCSVKTNKKILWKNEETQKWKIFRASKNVRNVSLCFCNQQIKREKSIVEHYYGESWMILYGCMRGCVCILNGYVMLGNICTIFTYKKKTSKISFILCI